MPTEPTITKAELEALARGAWGRNWQTAIARRIGVDSRTVRRYAAGDIDIPAERAAAIRSAVDNKRKAEVFAREHLDAILREAEAAGLLRSEVLAELAERALLHSSIAQLAARKAAKPVKRAA